MFHCTKYYIEFLEYYTSKIIQHNKIITMLFIVEINVQYTYKYCACKRMEIFTNLLKLWMLMIIIWYDEF